MLGGILDSRTRQGFVVDNNLTGTTYRQQSGESAQDAARRGMSESLRQNHHGQRITGYGLGVDPTYQGAIQNRPPIARMGVTEQP
jgi:hypothetical protein